MNYPKKENCLLLSAVAILLAIVFYIIGIDNPMGPLHIVSIICCFLFGLLLVMWVIAYLHELDDRLKQLENK